MRQRAWAHALAIGVMGCLLAGCSKNGDKPAITAPMGGAQADASGQTAAVITPVAAGIALPPGYKVDASRTFVLGTDENWTGRLSYSTPTSADDVYDFLHREMPSFGWTETTAMRSDVSLLNFVSTNGMRVATIHIERNAGIASGNSRVDMVVAPVAAAATNRANARSPGAPVPAAAR